MGKTMEKIRNTFNHLKNINHRTYVMLALLMVSISVSILFFGQSYIRTWESIKGLWDSLLVFMRIKPKDVIPSFPNEPSNSAIIIPQSVREFIYLFKSWAIIILNKDFFLLSIYDFLLLFVNLMKFAVFLPYLYIIWILVKHMTLYENDNVIYSESKALIRFKQIENKRLLPMVRYIESWRLYLKYELPNWIRYSFIFLFLFSYRVIAMIIDFLSFYLVFTVTFKISRLFTLLGSYLIDLIIILLEYSKISIMLPIIYFVIKRRHQVAKDRLMKMREYNMFEQTSHGVSNMISGPPGTGKTELMTALSFLATEELIANALEKIKKFSKMFPDFPWPLLEAYIRRGIEERYFVNRAQLTEHLKRLFNDAFDESNAEEIKFVDIFRYDPLTEKSCHFDGIKYISLGDAVAIYAEAFFLYDSRKPLHFSNYSVVHNFRVSGKFPIYNFNTIALDKEMVMESIAHIMKFDAHRLYNKAGDSILNEDESYLMDGHVESLTEIDKERGNKTTQSGQRMTELEANQINDGFNDSIKTIRHEYTIDGTPFVKIYNDTQRPNSVNADLRETNEGRLEIQSRSDIDIVFPLFELDYLIFGFISKVIDNYLLEFRSLRVEGTLYNHLLSKVSSVAGNRLQRLYNVYSYSRLSYKYRRNVSSDSTGDSSNRVFYMINQITRANNYATDAYSEYFKSERLKATKGFYDAPRYKTYRASVQEIDAQGSYWGGKLKAMTKTVVELEDDSTESDRD